MPPPARMSMPSLDAIQPVHDRYRRRRRVSIGIAVGAVLAATVYLFWPLFSGQASYFEWDVPEQYWPDLVFLCDSIHAGMAKAGTVRNNPIPILRLGVRGNTRLMAG